MYVRQRSGQIRSIWGSTRVWWGCRMYALPIRFYIGVHRVFWSPLREEVIMQL